MSRQPNGSFIGRENITDNTNASGIYTLSDVAQKVAANEFPPSRYTPSRSLRFDNARQTYLQRTFTTSTNIRKFTFAAWIKRTTVDIQSPFMSRYVDGNNFYNFGISANNKFYIYDIYNFGSYVDYGILGTAVLKDPAAWYHVVFSYDTTLALDVDRCKLYINGVRDTLTDWYGIFPQNYDSYYLGAAGTHRLGYNTDNGAAFNGYMSEVYYIDGQALDASAFGEYDSRSGEWKSKKYTGTFGNNGSYLSFANNSSLANLGLDDGTGTPGSGAGSNDWTLVNHSLTAGVNYDSMVDVPGFGATVTNDTGGVVRGNYCTWNPLAQFNVTLSAGNLQAYCPSGSSQWTLGTFGVTSGKWYYEVTSTQTSSGNNLAVGWIKNYVGSGEPSVFSNSNSWTAYANVTYNGGLNSTALSYGTWDLNETLMIALDADTGKIWFGVNGVWNNNISPSTGDGAMYTNLLTSGAGTFIPVLSEGSSFETNTGVANFGQRPFAYTPPAGFKSLCTSNLPEPTIKRPAEHFDIKLWTGNTSNTTIGNNVRTTDNYQISRSLRFSRADSSYLYRNAVTPTDGKKATMSFWIKKSDISVDTNDSYRTIFYCGTPNSDGLRVAFARYGGYDNHEFQIAQDFGSSSSYFGLRTTQYFRDTSAWYHFVIRYDSTDVVAANRQRIYVNGVEITSFISRTNAPLNHIPTWQINGTQLKIGRGRDDVNEYIDMYLTEFNFIDGQALDASSFGQFDIDGSWQPKRYTGTYGNNGFYLNFSDNSNTTATTLGKDQAGSNNFTPSGFSVTAGAGNDSLVDVPTNWGGDDIDSGGEIRGNYETWDPRKKSSNITYTNGNLTATGTAGTTHPSFGSIIMSSGKWYWENTVLSNDAGGFPMFGVIDLSSSETANTSISDPKGLGYYQSGTIRKDSVNIITGRPTFTNGNVISVAFDADTGKVWFAKDGTWLAGLNGSTGNPGAGTNEVGIVSAPISGYVVGGNAYNSASFTSNFGQRAFAYTPPTGFKSINTKNIQQTFPFTSGPDLVMIKSRSDSGNWVIADTVRGPGREIFTSLTNAEQTGQPNQFVTNFTSNGFQLGLSSTGNGNVNLSGTTYVGYCWNAGSRTVTNQDGVIPSNVRVNKTAGFSIVSYSGIGSDSNTGHGLGKTPDFIIWKALDDAYNWDIYHKSLGHTATLIFSASTTRNVLHAAPTNLTIPVKHTYTGGSATGKKMIAYCWYEVPGFSKFGSYTGNGSTDGAFIYTGFKPKYVLFKRIAAESWVLADAARSPVNPLTRYLLQDATTSETNASINYEFLSNGIKFRNNSQNESGSTYIYIAFAEMPFRYALAR